MRNESPLDFAPGETDPLDALIDSAARQMVAGDPPSSLRSEVRERVAGRRPVWSPVPAWGIAVGVALVLLIVGRTLLGPAGTPGERDTVHPAIQQPTIAAVPEPGPQVVDPAGARSVRLQADQQRLTRRLADDVATVPQEEEPLIPPIAIEPLEPVQIAIGNPIAVESSGVMPIEIEPLQIEPLRSIE